MPRKALVDEIQTFQREKSRLIPALCVLGIAGLLLPVLPGMLFLALAFGLLFPREGERYLNKLVHKVRRLLRGGGR